MARVKRRQALNIQAKEFVICPTSNMFLRSKGKAITNFKKFEFSTAEG